MKDNLFAILLTLFEKTLIQLKKNHHFAATSESRKEVQVNLPVLTETQVEVIQFSNRKSTRIFNGYEKVKLSNTSYQFLLYLMTLDFIPLDIIELAISQLMLSNAEIVSLQETKWTIRSILANHLPPNQLTFLDLVLYQQEDGLPLH